MPEDVTISTEPEARAAGRAAAGASGDLAPAAEEPARIRRRSHDRRRFGCKRDVQRRSLTRARATALPRFGQITTGASAAGGLLERLGVRRQRARSGARWTTRAEAALKMLARARTTTSCAASTSCSRRFAIATSSRPSASSRTAAAARSRSSTCPAAISWRSPGSAAAPLARRAARRARCRSHLHARGYRASRLKARNVLFAARRRARLIDFASARPLDAGLRRRRRDGRLHAGAGARRAVAAADCFAFAVLLYELVDGAIAVRRRRNAPAAGEPPRAAGPPCAATAPLLAARRGRAAGRRRACREGLSVFARCHRICVAAYG